MDINKYEVAQRINKIRIRHGMTLEEFGKKFNTSKNSVHNWESARNLPNNTRLIEIADFGNMDLEELLYGNPSIEEILIEKLNLYINNKRDTFKQEIKLLTESGIEGLARLVGRGKGMADSAVKDYEDHRNRIKKLEHYGQNYIKDNYRSYSYDNFINKFPNSDLNEFKEYVNSEWDKIEIKLNEYWESLTSTIDYYSWINSRFTDQITEELNKISQIAIEKGKEDYYVNEVVQPFLDQTAKDFKEYIKENTDIE